MTEPLIQAQNISHQFNDQKVLQNISVSIHPEEIITLIGPNGAGKSTLLSILLGLITPTEGIIQRAPNLQVGFMPQKIQIDPTLPMTVKRFLQLGAQSPNELPTKGSFQTLLQAFTRKLSTRDQSKKEQQKLISHLGWKEIIKQLNIDKLLDKPIQKISGGEMQRILLARALMRQPDLLVLDEPVQGVDLQGQAELYQYINQLRNHYGISVLMVSHDLHLVMNHTDQVLCLNQHICCSGHPQSVSQSEEYQNLFGEYADSIAVYEHHHHHDQCEHAHGEGHIQLPKIQKTHSPQIFQGPFKKTVDRQASLKTHQEER